MQLRAYLELTLILRHKHVSAKEKDLREGRIQIRRGSVESETDGKDRHGVKPMPVQTSDIQGTCSWFDGEAV